MLWKEKGNLRRLDKRLPVGRKKVSGFYTKFVFLTIAARLPARLRTVKLSRFHIPKRARARLAFVGRRRAKIEKGFEVMAISQDLLDILACPACKAKVELKQDGSGLKCQDCKRVYPVRDDIPVMLIDEATIEDEEPAQKA